MGTIHEMKLQDVRKETDSLGEVDVPADKLWGAQTQRSLERRKDEGRYNNVMST